MPFVEGKHPKQKVSNGTNDITMPIILSIGTAVQDIGIALTVSDQKNTGENYKAGYTFLHKALIQKCFEGSRHSP